jgi:hypothetical protein
VRVNAWVSGGFLPKAMRGRKLDGLSAIWDWYKTFSVGLGGEETFVTCLYTVSLYIYSAYILVCPLCR